MKVKIIREASQGKSHLFFTSFWGVDHTIGFYTPDGCVLELLAEYAKLLPGAISALADNHKVGRRLHSLTVKYVF